MFDIFYGNTIKLSNHEKFTLEGVDGVKLTTSHSVLKPQLKNFWIHV